jgi:hypothetical protein
MTAMDTAPGMREKADVIKVRNPSPLLRVRNDERKAAPFVDVPFLAGVFFSPACRAWRRT